jgi:predicted SnoaL-like aldol condensation-catalyzing enzyme
MTPTEIVTAFVIAAFGNFDADAARALLKPDYIQHNPSVPTGAEPVLGFIPALKESGLTAETHRIIAEGDFVVLHNTYSNAALFGADTLIGIDVFRVQDGKVAEHWDNLQAPTGQNPSGHSMTDGVTNIKDLEKTAQNKELVIDFVETVLKKGDASRITDFISTTTYIQHNPNIGDGLDGLGAALAAMAETNVTMVYKETPLVVAQGNFVFTGSQGTLGGQPTAFFDIFRVDDGKIVEHWDVISEIPATMAHNNGKF